MPFLDLKWENFKYIGRISLFIIAFVGGIVARFFQLCRFTHFVFIKSTVGLLAILKIILAFFAARLFDFDIFVENKQKWKTFCKVLFSQEIHQ